MTNATPQIHCSTRTLKEIGVPPKSIGYGDSETDQFFCGYCNLLYINRKKHLMFVNAATRYPLLSALNPQPSALNCQPGTKASATPFMQ